MNYLVDTNVISEIRKKDRCNPNVATWFASVDDDDIYLSVLTLGEIRGGLERIRGKDPPQARALEHWLSELAKSHAARIIPIDQAVADAWGHMSARRNIPAVDGLMAATAKVHSLTLATRNVAHVADLGALVFNPFAHVARGA